MRNSVLLIALVITILIGLSCSKYEREGHVDESNTNAPSNKPVHSDSLSPTTDSMGIGTGVDFEASDVFHADSILDTTRALHDRLERVGSHRDFTPIDTTAAETSSTVDTVIGTDVDGGGPASVEADIQKKSAVLGYSYIPEMKRNEIKNINVFISVNNSSSSIIDTLNQIIKDQAILTSTDTLIMKLGTRNVAFYKFVEVTLLDPAKAFSITKVHNNDEQRVDLNDGNRWRWAIKANTDKEIGTLIIKVVAKTPDGVTDRLEDINIPIRIKIDDDIFRASYLYLKDNPDRLLFGILIPLIAYILKRIFEGRKIEE